MQSSTSINTRGLFFKKYRKHFPLFLELPTQLGASQFSHYVLCTACDDSNLHAVQAGNLGAVMAGSLPSCL